MTTPIEEVMGWSPVVNDAGAILEWRDPDGVLHHQATPDDKAMWLIKRGINASVSHNTAVRSSSGTALLIYWTVYGVDSQPGRSIDEAYDSAVRKVAGK